MGVCGGMCGCVCGGKLTTRLSLPSIGHNSYIT